MFVFIIAIGGILLILSLFIGAYFLKKESKKHRFITWMLNILTIWFGIGIIGALIQLLY